MAFFIQSLAVLSVTFFLISYHCKIRNKILLLQFVGLIFWSIHFALLSAWTGLWLSIANSIFAGIFIFKGEKWVNKKILILSFIVFALLTTLSWETFSIFCFAGVMLHTLARWQTNPQHIRYLAISSQINWIIYDYFIKSYGGIIAETLLLVSVIISIYKNQPKE